MTKSADDGLMYRGLMIRYLVMPNEVINAAKEAGLTNLDIQ